MNLKSLSLASLAVATLASGLFAADEKPVANKNQKPAATSKSSTDTKPAATPQSGKKVEAKKVTPTTTGKKGEKPATSPGWVILEEDWFFPLRFESVTALNNARTNYRRNEEKMAASEIRKAVSWLRYAESHSDTKTKDNLTKAVEDLSEVAKDLEEGRLNDAARFDTALANASHSLAEWHLFYAKENARTYDEHQAAQNLQAAAMHLQWAADSAHYQFGADTVKVFSDIYRDGKHVSSDETVEHNRLGMNLDSIEKAIRELGDRLRKN